MGGALIVALSRLAPVEVSRVVVALVGRMAPGKRAAFREVARRALLAMEPREWAEVWREVAMGVAGSAAAE